MNLGIGGFSRFEREVQKVRDDIRSIVNTLHVNPTQQVFLDQKAVAESARHVATALTEFMEARPNVDELRQHIEELESSSSRPDLVDQLLSTWLEVQRQIVTGRGVALDPDWEPKTEQLAVWCRRSERELQILADASRQLVSNPWGMEKRTIATLIEVARMTLDGADVLSDEKTAREFTAHPDPRSTSATPHPE